MEISRYIVLYNKDLNYINFDIFLIYHNCNTTYTS